MADDFKVSSPCPQALGLPRIGDHTVNTIDINSVIRINFLNFMELRVIYDQIDLLPADLRELLHLLDECLLSTVFFYRI